MQDNKRTKGKMAAPPPGVVFLFILCNLQFNLFSSVTESPKWVKLLICVYAVITAYPVNAEI